VDAHPIDTDPDSDSTYHPDAEQDSDLIDADADPSFQIKAQILGKVLK
jgi:hypothetical protein